MIIKTSKVQQSAEHWSIRELKNQQQVLRVKQKMEKIKNRDKKKKVCHNESLNSGV